MLPDDLRAFPEVDFSVDRRLMRKPNGLEPAIADRFGTLLKFTEDTFNLGHLGANAVDQSPFIGSLDQCFDWSRARCSCSISSAAVLDFIAKSCSHYVIPGERVCSN
jgi:hypothetical protein